MAFLAIWSSPRPSALTKQQQTHEALRTAAQTHGGLGWGGGTPTPHFVGFIIRPVAESFLFYTFGRDYQIPQLSDERMISTLLFSLGTRVEVEGVGGGVCGGVGGLGGVGGGTKTFPMGGGGGGGLVGGGGAVWAGWCMSVLDPFFMIL